MAAPILAIVGPPGVGKTAVREALKPRFDTPVISIGPDYMAWARIFSIIDQFPKRLALIECCRIPQWEWHERANQRGAFYVELMAPSEVRRQRLAARGETPGRIAELMLEDGEGTRLESPDLQVDAADQSSEAIAAQIYEAFQTRK